MTVHFVTGVLGGGKTLIAVSRALEYMRRGRPVATNIDLFFDKFPDNYTSDKPNCIRIPDHPTSQDLRDLGYGNTGYDEENNGLLVFDECGTWFNSHGWNDPDRKEFTDVLIHIRKLGWDVIFLVQDFEMVDKQCRNAIGEFVVHCRRTDKINIPILSFLTVAMTGKPFPLPRMHIGTVMYGKGANRIKSETWRYRGTDLFDFYDTKQIFSPSYDHGNYCYLKPSNFHYDKVTKQRAKKDYQRRSIKRIWHIRPPVLFFFVLGFFASILFTGLFSIFGAITEEEVILDDVSSDESVLSVDDVLVDSIRLSGVFRQGNFVRYFFLKDDRRYDPAEAGFAYLPKGDCGATLVKDDYRKNIYCTRSDDVL